MTPTAARLNLLIAAIAAIAAMGVLGAAVITTVGQATDAESCSVFLQRADKLSPAVKRVYERPGPPPRGVPRLADSEEIRRCGNPERLLEEAGR